MAATFECFQFRGRTQPLITLTRQTVRIHFTDVPRKPVVQLDIGIELTPVEMMMTEFICGTVFQVDFHWVEHVRFVTVHLVI